jgi:hypothetical protein
MKLAYVLFSLYLFCYDKSKQLIKVNTKFNKINLKNGYDAYNVMNSLLDILEIFWGDIWDFADRKDDLGILKKDTHLMDIL